jgi:hypothetical protein
LRGDERRLKKSKTTDTRRRRSTKFECKFDCFSWSEDYYAELLPSPENWQQKPLDKYASGGVAYLPIPAANVPASKLTSNEYDKSQDVTIGGSDAAKAFYLDKFSDKLWTEWQPTTLDSTNAAPTPQPLLKVNQSTKVIPGGSNIRQTTYTRTAEWTDTTAKIASNCITGEASGASVAEQVGNLKLCFEQTKLQEMTIMAEATKDNGKWKLQISKTHLQAGGNRLGSGGLNGYVLEKDKIKTMAEIFAGMSAGVEQKKTIGRICGPLLLWLAFYCFLTPLVWCIDKFGDMMEMIPCCGDCLGAIVDVIETLATILICCVSFCNAMACALMIMAIAWVFYRPMVGIPLLICSCCICGGMVYFCMSRKGEPKVRGKKRRSRAPPPEAPQMEMGMAQPMATAEAVPQNQMQVVCPEDSGPGQNITITTPDGREMSVAVPGNVWPGQAFMVQI